jgi:uncharacterized protein (DUF697 family)
VTLQPGAVFGLIRELRATAVDPGPIVVTGALSDVLRRELTRDGGAGAVRSGSPEGVSVLVHVLASPLGEEDLRVLKAASRARVPIVAVLAGPGISDRVPYVLATDVVRVPKGSGFPVDEIARAIVKKLDEDATGLASHVPVLRRPMAEALTQRFSRRAGIVGAAVFVPGVDLPVLTLMQLRLVLRIGAVYGEKLEAERVPEVLAVIGSGLAFRAVARQALAVVPLAGWVVKGGVAFVGTRALGEAAIRYYEARTQADGGSVRPGT